MFRGAQLRLRVKLGWRNLIRFADTFEEVAADTILTATDNVVPPLFELFLLHRRECRIDVDDIYFFVFLDEMTQVFQDALAKVSGAHD